MCGSRLGFGHNTPLVAMPLHTTAEGEQIATLRSLLTSLKGYAEHDGGCATNQIAADYSCSCGLTDLLAMVGEVVK
jgi:hypothetical protein